MKKIWHWAYLALPLMLCADGEEVMKLHCIQSANLIRNADFKQITGNGLPREWTFDNCSKSPHFKSKVVHGKNGNYLAVNTEWIKFGYWVQNIPVKEGVSYYVGCEVQSDAPSVAVWLQCRVEKRGVKKKPADRTSHLFFRHACMGDDMREQLKDYVDEELIVSMSAKNWTRLNKEIVIPTGLGIRVCTLRMGIYGGGAGQARYRNPVFRESQSRLEVEISGSGWTRLSIPGAKPDSVKLDSSAKQQTISVILPVALRVYKVDLINQNGSKVTKEVSNE